MRDMRLVEDSNEHAAADLIGHRILKVGGGTECAATAIEELSNERCDCADTAAAFGRASSAFCAPQTLPKAVGFNAPMHRSVNERHDRRSSRKSQRARTYASPCENSLELAGKALENSTRVFDIVRKGDTDEHVHCPQG
jgi:hypothetical protein